MASALLNAGVGRYAIFKIVIILSFMLFVVAWLVFLLSCLQIMYMHLAPLVLQYKGSHVQSGRER